MNLAVKWWIRLDKGEYAMKKLLAPILSATWLDAIAPEWVNWPGRYSPPSRSRTVVERIMENKPFVAGVLIAPFSLYLVYRGAGVLRRKGTASATE
jgi:hypothetical protein